MALEFVPAKVRAARLASVALTDRCWLRARPRRALIWARASSRLIGVSGDAGVRGALGLCLLTERSSLCGHRVGLRLLSFDASPSSQLPRAKVRFPRAMPMRVSLNPAWRSLASAGGGAAE